MKERYKQTDTRPGGYEGRKEIKMTIEMRENLNKLEKAYGRYTFEGKEFLLTQNAYLSNWGNEAVYEAIGIEANAEPDEEGTVDAYDIVWGIKENFDVNEEADECDACDWSKPVSIKKFGRYNISEKLIF